MGTINADTKHDMSFLNLVGQTDVYPIPTGVPFGSVPFTDLFKVLPKSIRDLSEQFSTTRRIQ